MVGEVYDLWTASLKFDRESFASVQTLLGFRYSVTIFFLAAVSKGLGEAGIMMINRANKRQFARGLLGNAVTLSVSALVWSSCIWLSCQWPIGLNLNFRDVLGLVLVSYAPLVFSFLAIIPHVGLLWDGVLKFWMLLITIAGLNLAFAVPVWQAIACSGVGWLFFHLLTELFGTRVERLRLRLLGRHRWVRPKDAAVALLDQAMGAYELAD